MVGSIDVHTLKESLEANALLLVDVRTQEEWETAQVEGARLMDDSLLEELHALPRDTPIAFICHHGIRSHAAAVYFFQQGFTNVHNVVGGIDAWSLEVDPTVPRY